MKLKTVLVNDLSMCTMEGNPNLNSFKGDNWYCVTWVSFCDLTASSSFIYRVAIKYKSHSYGHMIKHFVSFLAYRKYKCIAKY